MNPKILVTLGPKTFDKNNILTMAKEGIYLFRINLSHTPIEELEKTIKLIQNSTNVPVCLDSEGAQVRNQKMENGEVFFKEGDLVKVHNDDTLGDEKNISFTPSNIAFQLEVGDEISVDFNSVLLKSCAII